MTPSMRATARRLAPFGLLILLYLSPPWWPGWEVGLLLHGSLLLLATAYALRSKPWARRLALGRPLRVESGRKWRLGGLFGALYLLDLLLLWFGPAGGDPTLLNQALIVVALAGLVGGPQLGLTVGAFAATGRAGLALFAGHYGPLEAGNWLLVWSDPGVSAVLAAMLVGLVGYRCWFGRDRRYPLWLALPFAGAVEAIYLAAVYVEWGEAGAMSLLRYEAPLGAFGLALALALGFRLLRVTADDHRRRRNRSALLRQARRERDEARAGLYALQARWDPALQAATLRDLETLLRQRPERAGELLNGLACRYERIAERHGRRGGLIAPVALRDELHQIDAYLGLEQARYGDRLDVARRIGEDCLDLPLPFLAWLPLVECAVEHGVTAGSRRVMLMLGARRERRQLVLTLADDGGADWPDAGVGKLRAVRARLQAQYGDAATLRVEPTAAGGTRVELRLPLGRGAGRDAGTAAGSGSGFELALESESGAGAGAGGAPAVAARGDRRDARPVIAEPV